MMESQDQANRTANMHETGRERGNQNLQQEKPNVNVIEARTTETQVEPPLG